MSGEVVAEASKLPIGPIPLILLAVFLISAIRLMRRRAVIDSQSAFVILMIATTISSIGFFRLFAPPNHIPVFLLSQVVSTSIFFIVAAFLSRRSIGGYSPYAQRFLSQSAKESLSGLARAVAAIVVIGIVIFFSGNKLNEDCHTERCRSLDLLIGSHENGFFYLYLLNVFSSVFFCVFAIELYNIFLKTSSRKGGM